MLLPNSASLEKLQSYINQQHPNMNFTTESEDDNSLPFLDVYVTRVQSSFITSVYRKPTFSGVYTHFTSYLPSVYKESLVSTLLYRAYRICSSWKEIHTEITRTKDLMSRNGYPAKFIDKLVSYFLIRMREPNPIVNDEKKSILIVLPFLGSSTKNLEKTIKQTIRNCLPDLQCRFIYRASTRMSTMFQFKDRIPDYMKSGIVYKYKCSGCNSTYIGETIRHAKRRFHEHLGLSALSGKSMKTPVPPAISDHSTKCQTKPQYKNFKILCSNTNNEAQLRIKESLFIHRDKPNLNIQGQSIKLNLFKG